MHHARVKWFGVEMQSHAVKQGEVLALGSSSSANATVDYNHCCSCKSSNSQTTAGTLCFLHAQEKSSYELRKTTISFGM